MGAGYRINAVGSMLPVPDYLLDEGWRVTTQLAHSALMSLDKPQSFKVSRIALVLNTAWICQFFMEDGVARTDIPRSRMFYGDG